MLHAQPPQRTRVSCPTLLPQTTQPSPNHTRPLHTPLKPRRLNDRVKHTTCQTYISTSCALTGLPQRAAEPGGPPARPAHPQLCRRHAPLKHNSFSHAPSINHDVRTNGRPADPHNPQGYRSVLQSQVAPQHAQRTLSFASAMLAESQAVIMPGTNQEPVKLRVGIHSGPVVSGVVGTRMPR